MLTLGSSTLVSAGGTWLNAGMSEAFIAKFNPTGDVLWAVSAGGPGDDFPYGLAVRSEDLISIAGAFQDTASFGSNQLTSKGGTDLFLARLAPSPPVLHLPNDIIVTNDHGLCGAAVSFSVSATDPSVLPGSNQPPVSCGYPSGYLFPVGVTTNVCTVTGGAGIQASGSFTITVLDLEAPSIQKVVASPALLWPPNHKMIPVELAVSATDNCDIQSMKIIKVIDSDAPDNPDESNGSPDWVQTGDLTLLLRAERKSANRPRTYSFTVEVTDFSGNRTSRDTNVIVPVHE